MFLFRPLCPVRALVSFQVPFRATTRSSPLNIVGINEDFRVSILLDLSLKESNVCGYFKKIGFYFIDTAPHFTTKVSENFEDTKTSGQMTRKTIKLNNFMHNNFIKIIFSCVMQ